VQVYTDGMGAMKVDFRKGKADMQDLWNVLQTKLLIPPPPPPCVECKGVGCNFCDMPNDDMSSSSNDHLMENADDEGQEMSPIIIMKKQAARAVNKGDACTPKRIHCHDLTLSPCSAECTV
jgi:hypothetical protein